MLVRTARQSVHRQNARGYGCCVAVLIDAVYHAKEPAPAEAFVNDDNEEEDEDNDNDDHGSLSRKRAQTTIAAADNINKSAKR
jgi:hypothetical protein